MFMGQYGAGAVGSNVTGIKRKVTWGNGKEALRNGKVTGGNMKGTEGNMKEIWGDGKVT